MCLPAKQITLLWKIKQADWNTLAPNLIIIQPQTAQHQKKEYIFISIHNRAG